MARLQAVLGINHPGSSKCKHCGEMTSKYHLLQKLLEKQQICQDSSLPSTVPVGIRYLLSWSRLRACPRPLYSESEAQVLWRTMYSRAPGKLFWYRRKEGRRRGSGTCTPWDLLLAFWPSGKRQVISFCWWGGVDLEETVGMKIFSVTLPDWCHFWNGQISTKLFLGKISVYLQNQLQGEFMRNCIISNNQFSDHCHSYLSHLNWA